MSTNELPRIEIKLKECCLTCEHFSPDGVIGFSAYGFMDKRIIACGHMCVCGKYLDADERKECKAGAAGEEADS